MDTKKIVKAICAIGTGIVLIGAGAFGANIMSNDTIQEQATQISYLSSNNDALNAQVYSLKNTAATIETIEVPVEVIKEVQVEKIVEIDNGNLELVLDHIYENDGQVQYLLNDLDDDEIDMIVERVFFANEIKVLAAIEVKNEIKDMLDKEDFIFNGVAVKFDEDDIERVRVQDDSDELIITDIDFEDSDSTVEVEVYFEQDDVKYKALVEVEFRDSKIDDTDLISVEER